MKKFLYLLVTLICCGLMIAPPPTRGQRGLRPAEIEPSRKMQLLFPVAGHSNLSLVGDATVVEKTQSALKLQAGAVWNRDPLNVADGFMSAFRFQINPGALQGATGTLTFFIQSAGETAAPESSCERMMPGSLSIGLN